MATNRVVFFAFNKHPKFSDFAILKTSYKQVADHDIAVDIFIPNGLTASLLNTENKIRRPIIVRFHGGGLFTGSSIYADWFPSYLLAYASRQSVPIISADYRLMPESTGIDILEDLIDFWKWLHHGLHLTISACYPSLQVDTDCILAEGESAGGYLVVQAALSRLRGLRAVIAAFPMLDLRAPHFTRKYEKVMGGVQMLPKEIITNHLKSMNEGDVVSNVIPPARLDLGTAVIQQGRFVEFLGEDPVLFPIWRANALADSVGSMPRLWIYHGKQDTGVPAEGSVRFAEEARKVWTDAELRLDLPDGEHGFHEGKDLDTIEWLKEGLIWVEKPWLSGLDRICTRGGSAL